MLILRQRVRLDLVDFERVENAHSYRVRALVRQVTSDTTADPFFCLSNINRLAVVVVEKVDPPLVGADFPILPRARIAIRQLEEFAQRFSKFGGFKRRRTFWSRRHAAMLFGGDERGSRRYRQHGMQQILS